MKSFIKIVVIWLGFLLRNAYGLECYSCDSSINEDCATLKNELELKTCDGDCAVWVEGTKTGRGCVSDNIKLVLRNATCDLDKCNNFMYPSNRLKCVDCDVEQEDCVFETINYLYPCKNYVDSDTCYTFIKSPTEAIRGCLSDLDSNVDECDAAGKACIKCGEDVCNNDIGIDSISCQTCTKNDLNCGYLQNNSKNEMVCEALLGRENYCFSFNNGTDVTRGCLNKYPDIKLQCMKNEVTSGTSIGCLTCLEDSCNSQQIVEEQCIVCDNCNNILGDPPPTKCAETTYDKSGCYLSNKDGVINRGCVASLNTVDREVCEEGIVCKICKGEMCNRMTEVQSCYTCNSNDDPVCATLNGILEEKVCKNIFDTCRVFVNAINMTTHRGCTSELESTDCSPQTINCRECSGKNCNGEIFPSSRLNCVQCNSSSKTDYCYIPSNSTTADICLNYNFRDSCFSYVDSSKKVHRGCLSDNSEYSELCKEDGENCFTCSDQNCNLESIVKKPELSCIICDTMLGDDCSWGFNPLGGMKCKLNRLFNEVETCYSVQISDVTVIRGCTLDGNVCRSSLHCLRCTGNGCNNLNIVKQSCIKCSSENDENCGMYPHLATNYTCEGTVEYDKRGCFMSLNEGVLTRGCYSDLSFSMQDECTSENENCHRCFEDDCNNDPSSAQSISVTIILIQFIGVLIIFNI